MAKRAVDPDTAPRRSTRTKINRAAESDDDNAEASEEDQVQKPKQNKRARASKPSAKPMATKRGKSKAEDSADEGPATKKAATTKAANDMSGSAADDTAGGVRQTKKDTSKSGKKQASKQAKSDAQASNAATTKSAAAKPAAAKPAAGGQSGSTQAAASADPACPKAHTATVVEEYDVMLNQTNIGANNNKFYRMQLLLEGSSDHWLWTKWGRVGDKGQTQLQGPFDADLGQKEFKKKFRCCHCTRSAHLHKALFPILPARLQNVYRAFNLVTDFGWCQTIMHCRSRPWWSIQWVMIQ